MQDTVDKKIMELERAHDWISHSYKGVFYWNIIRIYLPRFVNEGKNVLNPIIASGQRNAYNRKRFFATVRACAYALFHPRRLKRADVLFANRHQMRMVDGVYKDWYLDYIQTDYSEEHISFAQEFFIEDTYKKCPTSCFTYLRFRFVVWFYNKGLLNLGREELAFIRHVEDTLNKSFGVQMKHLEYFITSTLVFYRVYKPFIRRVLDRVRPRVVFMQNYTSITNAMISEEGRARGITCIDMQHGFNVKDEAYTTIPSIHLLPRYIFTFGSAYDGCFSLPEGCEAVSVGYPYRDEMAARYGGRMSPDVKGVVFYSVETDRERYMRFILDFAALCRPWGFNVSFKIRPDETAVGRITYKALTDNGVALLDGDADLYQIIFSYKYHVSFSSTVLVEALFEHTRVYDCDYLTGGTYQALIKEGYMDKVDTPQELWERMQSPLPQRRDTDRLWRADAVGNIRAQVRRIMERAETGHV